MAAQVTEYELQRAQRIMENRRKMEQLGLLEASRGLALAVGAAGPPGAPLVTLEAGTERQPPRKKRKVQQVSDARSLEICKWCWPAHAGCIK